MKPHIFHRLYKRDIWKFCTQLVHLIIPDTMLRYKIKDHWKYYCLSNRCVLLIFLDSQRATLLKHFVYLEEYNKWCSKWSFIQRKYHCAEALITNIFFSIGKFGLVNALNQYRKFVENPLVCDSQPSLFSVFLFSTLRRVHSNFSPQ